ncbi:MAG: Wzy polymerase domain-containing protein [Methylotenera sp.]|nr:Wzy polymerase domain-containing protein [Methylotenera sp.]MDP2402994.1 Wzy polymerase domain-containing protein [Methylotenera sp.]MDP3094500.1 Wzy polymerase domain-containing protein [Methylotenera sp.]MDZ4223534.1 Wzy polymerase domain-containing protein [Methylotenera sp.]
MFSRILSVMMSPNVSLLMLGLMLVMPFVFPHHRQPIPSFFGEWLTAMFAMMAIVPMLYKHRWQPYTVPRIIFLPIGFIVLLVLQVAFGDIAYWQQHVLIAQYFFLMAVLLVLGAMLRQQLGFERTVSIFAGAILLAGLLSVVLATLQAYGISLNHFVMSHKSGGFSGNVGQTNHQANLLAIALCALVYHYMQQRIKLWLATVLALVLLFGLALTGARSAWLYVLLIPVISIVYKYFKMRSNTPAGGPLKSLLPFALALPLMFFLVQSLLPLLASVALPPMPSERMMSMAYGESIRLNMLKSAWHVFMTQPLLGVGFGQLAWHDLQLAELVPNLRGNFAQAHNLVMQLLAEAGLLGFTIFAISLVYWCNAYRKASLSPERWFVAMLLMIMLAHSMLEYPLWYAYFLAPTAFILGASDEKLYTVKWQGAPLLVALVLAISLVSLFQLLRDDIRIEYWFNEPTLDKLQENKFQLMDQHMRSVRHYSPLAAYGDATVMYALPINRDGLEFKAKALRKVLQGLPSAGHAYHYSTVLAMQGRMDEATAHLKKVYTRHPGVINNYWSEVVRLTLKGDIALYPLVQAIEKLRDQDQNETVLEEKPMLKLTPNPVAGSI